MVETHIEKRTQMGDDAGDFDHDKVSCTGLTFMYFQQQHLIIAIRDTLVDW